MEAVEHRFRAMGSDCQVLVVGDRPDPLLTYAERRLRRLESRWTRFSPDSELSRLNRRPGRDVVVHPDTLALVVRAVEGWRLTGGRYDPTVLPAVVGAGLGAPDLPPPPGRAARPAPGCGAVQVDRARGSVRLPDGVMLDPGGIGKGLAADVVADELRRGGAAGALVNVGGDLRVCGRAPSAAGWLVGVEDPFDTAKRIAVHRLGDGGVATTTPVHRRWSRPGHPVHHVIDPRTGAPSTTDVASVTVLASHAWQAEVVAKAAALAGAAAGVDLIDDLGVSGIVVSVDGRVVLSSRLGAFL